MITIVSALLSVLSFRFRSRASLELELVALRHQLAVLRRQRPGRLRSSSKEYNQGRHTVVGMITIISALVSVLSFRFRRRASLELELVALRHQLAVLRRQCSGRPRIFSSDRLLWMWLYRIWPRALNAMVLVKRATVIQWHRKGFRLYWRWRSRSRCVGRPKVSSETRDLIRQMSMANPLWGAPRIHGELLKLGIEVSQATVGRYLPWRPKVPSPTWRTFLQNHMTDIVAVDMFVVAAATFRLFYALILLGHDRRRIIHFNITQNPTQAWLSRQMTEAFPWESVPRYLLRDRDAAFGPGFRDRVHAMGIEAVVTAPRCPWQNPYVEHIIWVNPPRMSRSHHHLQ